VPIDEPHDRGGVGGCHRHFGPEGIVDALLIDVGLIPTMAEREDAQTAVGLVDEAALDPFDGVGMRAAQRDTMVEVVTLPGCPFSSTATSTWRAS
jgi:hypothetical protein